MPTGYTPQSSLDRRKALMNQLRQTPMNDTGKKTDWGRGLAHMLRQYQAGSMGREQEAEISRNAELSTQDNALLAELIQDPKGKAAPDFSNMAITEGMDQGMVQGAQNNAVDLPSIDKAEFATPEGQKSRLALMLRNKDVEDKKSLADTKFEKDKEIAEIRSAAAAGDPASIREWNEYIKMTPAKQKAYLTMKRSSKSGILDRGGFHQNVDAFPPQQGSVPQGQPKPTAELSQMPTFENGNNPLAQSLRGATPRVDAPVAPPVNPSVNGVYGKTVTPEKELEYVASAEEAKILGREAGEKKTNQNKFEATLASTFEKNGFLGKKIADAKRSSGDWTTGLIGAAASQVAGTPAYDLNQTLESIRANIGFDKLQEMRINSPTGGALGQVSDRENLLLQAVWGSLQQAQSRKQFESNLDDLERQIQSSWRRVAAAYEKDYGKPFDTSELELWQPTDVTTGEQSPAALMLEKIKAKRGG